MPASKSRILFIGNSFTARNNLPELITQLAREKGLEIEHNLISAGGASLRQHWNAGEAVKTIAEGNYDYVVLQEQSMLPIKNVTRFHENVRLFDEAIKASGAKTVLYMTWARKNAPETQKLLTDGYTQIGKELGAIVVPAGCAWEQTLEKNPDITLHDDDGSHPNLAGTYLAACVFCAALIKQNPSGGFFPKELEAREAAMLQKIAWSGRGKS